MMPTFPRSPLKFRKAGFPRYGFKAGRSDGTFPATPNPSAVRFVSTLCASRCHRLCLVLCRGTRCAGVPPCKQLMNFPGSQRTTCRDSRPMKARNHSGGRLGAAVLAHSEGSAYKPLCGEIALRLRVGRMGSVSVDGPGHYNLDRSEDLARCPGDSAADPALGAMECRLARVEPGLNHDSWLLSV